jgi:hypothetical protein
MLIPLKNILYKHKYNLLIAPLYYSYDLVNYLSMYNLVPLLNIMAQTNRAGERWTLTH